MGGVRARYIVRVSLDLLLSYVQSDSGRVAG